MRTKIVVGHFAFPAATDGSHVSTKFSRCSGEVKQPHGGESCAVANDAPCFQTLTEIYLERMVTLILITLK